MTRDTRRARLRKARAKLWELMGLRDAQIALNGHACPMLEQKVYLFEYHIAQVEDGQAALITASTLWECPRHERTINGVLPRAALHHYRDRYPAVQRGYSDRTRKPRIRAHRKAAR